MTPEERFRRLDSLFDQALDLEGAARLAFLDRACGDDLDLRRELEALLEASRSAGSFLARPAMDVAAQALAQHAPPPLIGRTIGPYPVLALLGAGGMGEVYRAHDPRLGRDVAIKVLPPHLSQDTESLARFEREARAVAALSHPGILAIHDFGVDDGRAYAVMECLDGETLRARLERGPMPWRKAVATARQIAEGLAAAHAKGIVHRDLKPENIFLVTSGAAKILDFGLAHVPRTALPASLAAGVTTPGTVMGTTGYMSPEQVRGDDAGPPSDIFSFGCVVYEMLSGVAPFMRSTPAETMAAILRDEAPAIPAGDVPPELDAIVAHCLEKDPPARFRSASDMSFALQALGATRTAPAPALGVRRAWRAVAVTLGLIAATAALTAALTLWLGDRQGPAAAPPIRFTFSPPGVWVTTELENQLLAVAPDGGSVAFVAVADGKRSLWLRARDAVAAVRLAGTESAASPFWSPDSRSIAFLADGVLKRVEVSGGPPQAIARVPLAGGSGTWSADGVILLGGMGSGTEGGILKLAAEGGPVSRLTATDASRGESWHFWPHFLPDGRHFLYLADSRKNDEHTLYVGSIDGGTGVPLSTINSRAEYVAGFLLYVQDGTLVAHPFDPVTRRFTSSARPLADQIQCFVPTGLAAFSGSRDLLAYASGAVASRLVWLDRNGRELGTIGPQADHEDVRISPDGRAVATSVGDPRRGTRDVWIYDLARKTTMRFTTTDGSTEYGPIWSPDGHRLGFAGDLADGPPSLHWKALQDAGEPKVLLAPTGAAQWVDDWSPDGRFVAFEETDSATRKDVRLLPLFGDRTPIPLLNSPFNETQARFSPDGRWLAYASDESGRNEIHVRSLIGTPQKWQISYAGGTWPVWRRDGGELYFLSGDNRLTAVPVLAGGGFSTGAQQALFRIDPAGSGTLFDVADNGRRFLVNTNVTRAESIPITVAVGWISTLSR